MCLRQRLLHYLVALGWPLSAQGAWEDASLCGWLVRVGLLVALSGLLALPICLIVLFSG